MISHEKERQAKNPVNEKRSFGTQESRITVNICDLKFKKSFRVTFLTGKNMYRITLTAGTFLDDIFLRGLPY